MENKTDIYSWFTDLSRQQEKQLIWLAIYLIKAMTSLNELHIILSNPRVCLLVQLEIYI